MPETGLDILGKRLGSWKILLSFKAWKSLQRLGRFGNFGPIAEKLRHLASGAWSYHVAGTEQQKKRLRVPLAATRCNFQTFILWQIDLGLDDTTQTESQVVKVWEVGAKEDVNVAIDRVINFQQSYTVDHVAQCRQKPLEDRDKKSFPRVFSTDQESSAKPRASGEVLDIRTVDREVLDMANRFYALTEPMIRSVLANDLWAEFPYDFSADETRIILHSDTASLILGRSGTGKTTCLVFKLLARYIAGCGVADERPPRQLLLTRSPELANKLKSYVHRLMRTLAASLVEQPEQAVVAFPLPAVDIKDDEYNTIFELQNESYPLVCTFDRFLDLLENTIETVYRDGLPVTNEADEILQTHDSDQSDQSDHGIPSRHLPRMKAVDFQSFRLDYWPKFPAPLVRDLPIELVFAEIIGVIQGSISSRQTLKHLSREEYLKLSHKVAPTFSLENEKSRIYDIFQKYQTMKFQRQEFDVIDRAARLIQAFREDTGLKNLLATEFDDVYVDESQDLRCLEVELLTSLSNNAQAFTFAGDTAQTISQDSHLRFQDVKALFFDHFAAVASTMNQPELARPKLFTLARNYRSHQGILGLASHIMDLLWDGFPDTVDKLAPEIGEIYGPLPVFFLGCSLQVLLSNGACQADHSQKTLDFGAEQVVIVRDQSAKLKVQAQLQDKALVLTILQSKGMEFEDVFLWNFFTDSPCATGWRNIGDSKTKQGNFDAQKHVGMCSELKKFYVAITRARVRLSIIESEEALAAQAADLLKRDVLSPLVEVITSSDPHFVDELISLRSFSHDPEKWSLRGEEMIQRKHYEEAAICYRRAKNMDGETLATAHISEERGRRSAAMNDAKQAHDFFWCAIQNFKKLGMTADTVRNLVNVKKYKEAAQLWVQTSEPGLAAPLFVKAGMLSEAVDHYHQALEYDRAADVFRQGHLGEELLTYIAENQDCLSARSFYSHSRFCILLLKQRKLGPDSLVTAMKLLRSPAEQERILVEYEMHDQLEALYANQKRFKERFLLLSRVGKLDQALKAVSDLHPLDIEDLQGTIQGVQDYYFAGQVALRKLEKIDVPNRFRASNTDWRSAHRFLAKKERNSISEQLGAMKTKMVKDFLQLYTLLSLEFVQKIGRLDDIPFEAVENASRLAESVSMNADHSNSEGIVLLLTGIMKAGDETKPFTLLSWSPIREAAGNVNADEYPRVAREWFLTKLGWTMLKIDSKLRELWKSEWPLRCAHFLARGFCRRTGNGSCSFLHQKVKASDCQRRLSLLTKITTTFCGLTVTHRKGLMGNDFQQRFFGQRRFWLELLFQELTFVSSFEQSSQEITAAQAKIFNHGHDSRRERNSSVLLANLESLLFHRLGRNWEDGAAELSSLLEQVQLSQIFDWRVQERFSRYLRIRLSKSPSMGFQLHEIWALKVLEHAMGTADASSFEAHLRQFIRELPLAEVANYASFHSVTTMFEFFTAYLVFRCCRVAVIVPQSWIDIHLPWFSRMIQSQPENVASNREANIYAGCLLELIMCFCQLLSPPVSRFRLGLSHYPSRLLHQRNAQLVALAIVNLGSSNQRAAGYNEARQCSQEFLRKLVQSYRDYNGKEHVRLVRKAGGPYPPESQLQNLGVRAVAVTELLQTANAPEFLSQSLPSNETEAQQTRYKQAVEKIEHFWRSQYPKLLDKRAFLNSSFGKLYARVQEMCVVSTASREMRILLAGHGIPLHEAIRDMGRTASKQQQQAVELLVSGPEERFDQADEIVQLAIETQERLENVAKSMSLDQLAEIAGGGIGKVKQLFHNTEAALEKIASNMNQAAKMTQAIHDNAAAAGVAWIPQSTV